MSKSKKAHRSISLPTGHVSVVVGGGGALGGAIVEALASAGATVWSLDRTKEAAERPLSRLEGRHHAAAVDVTDFAAVTTAAQSIGPVDSVVYAAGLNYDGYVVDTDWAAYRRVLAVNLDGAFHVAAAFGRTMLDAKRTGAFVVLSSAAGLRGEAGAAVYCASKFGVIGLVESFAAEMAPNGIRANAICPGNVDSPMLKDVAKGIAGRAGTTVDEIYDAMATSGAAQRLIDPSEIADLAVYLVSPMSCAMTGSAIRIDAGAGLSV